MPEWWQILLALLVIFAVTYSLRLAPFVLLRRLRDSDLLDRIARTMPLGVMAVLVVYTLSSVDLGAAPYGAPEAGGVAVTVALHVWRRNAMVSIVGGTAAYMGLLALLG